MTLSTRRDADRSIVSLAGELDLATVAQLREAAQPALDDPTCAVLVLELAELTFLDSTGLGCWIELRNATEDTGKALLFESIPPIVMRTVSIAGLAPLFGFDGGARTAAVRSAEAGYDAQVANYRQVVLAAFAEVENQMAALRILAQQQGAQDKAVDLSRKAVEITLNEYRAGTQNFTTVVTAPGLLVTNEINALQVRLSRFTAAVTLIRALGGGWDVRSLPSDSELKGPSLPIDRGGQAVRPDE